MQITNVSPRPVNIVVILIRVVMTGDMAVTSQGDILRNYKEALNLATMKLENLKEPLKKNWQVI